MKALLKIRNEDVRMDLVQVTALGAIVGLVIAIVLIFIKIPPVYSLMIGALIGGIVGGATITETINLMVSGASGMMTSVLRILAAGILAGTLIESGAAETIAQSIIKWVGETRALLAMAVAALLLTAVGVFIDIAIITIAPIALLIAERTNISKSAILLAMIGGGKAGNIVSPNPNTIAIAGAFDAPLTSVMIAGIIPAIFALIVTFFLANRLVNKGSVVENVQRDDISIQKELPVFWKAISGPIVAIALLALRPLADISIDPMIALPIGGIVGALIMGKGKNIIHYMKTGLASMTGVAIILIGTGTIAGIIQNSTLGDVLINAISGLGLPIFLLAPISGILMSAATASTTSGATVAGQVFGRTLMDAGVAPLSGAAMVHSGATVLDHLPHGSFFHATSGAVGMAFNERLKLIPYESLIGLTQTIVSTIMFGILL